MASFPSSRFYSAKSSGTAKEAKLNLDRSKQHDESLVKMEKSPTRRLLEAHPAVCELQFHFRVFCRQQQAIEFARSCAMPKKVFAYELPSLGSQGQRRYLAESVFDFGQAYVSMKSNRHVYEVITEDTVCKLYFDVEFGLGYNPGVIGVELLEVLIRYICYLIRRCFGLAVNRNHILDLDSSSEVKFSRHLIFHLPGAVFQNNKQVGNFVRYACDQLRALKESTRVGSDASQSVHRALFPPCTPVKGPECPSAPQLLDLFVMDERGSPVLLCDESVYSRNRNFRLYLSSKLGKGVPLRVAQESKFKSQYGVDSGRRKRSQQFNLLVDSLVTHVRYVDECHILTFDDIASGPKRRKMGPCGSVEVLPPPAEGFTHSPYPLVDQFVLSQWTRGGVEPSIRKWTLFPHGECLVFEITNNRWCENVGRHHKSNHIMIVVDLASSVFYQKCHDPECCRVDFKSREYHIPAHINPLSKKVHPANQNADGGLFENDEFLQALSHSMDSCRGNLVPDGEGEEDDVWLKAFESVEQDASLGQPSAVCEVDDVVYDRAPGRGGGGWSMEEQEKGATGSSDLQCPVDRVNCKQMNRPPEQEDLLMTEEEMNLFLCE